ncbi:unnamed protein product [Bursaphelenchus xylophilus]|uniref:(pine wood nematode) hypothetical protein n=1 Tax=Bursaphelenchus xylophilus TaxID=6326 RepID=A0A1I7RVI1_BURXY|nr:unnamed protein product [Bursaphelenchus xylophilus]CAG9081701.1 unnamed protein product [Bursaphelenchus xylophilus]
MSGTVLKAGLLVAMVIMTAVAGLTPIWILRALRKRAHSLPSSKKKDRVSLFLCLLTCFSGGVFLATCFLHLFPELFAHVEMMKETYGFKPDFPMAELLACSGFFVLFLVEELVLIILPNAGHSHGSSKEEESVRMIRNRDQVGLLTSAEVESERHPAGFSNTLTATNTQAVSSPRQCSVATCPDATIPIIAEPERCEANCDSVKEYPPIITKSRPHPHSHSTRSVTIVLAIAFHAIIEGLALGVQTDPAKIWAIFISLTVHKLIVAFSIGLQLARTHAHSLKWVTLSMIMIAFMTPIGGAIGMVVRHASINAQLQDTIILICHGLTVGTFLYVTFFEVLIHERDNEHPNLLKLLVMIIGFALIGLIRLITEGHDHSHGHSHGHSHDHDHH